MHSYLLCLIVETFLLAKVCFSAFKLTLKSFIINLMGSISNPEKSSHFLPSVSTLDNHKGWLVASDSVEPSDCNFLLLSTLKCLIYPRSSDRARYTQKKVLVIKGSYHRYCCMTPFEARKCVHSTRTEKTCSSQRFAKASFRPIHLISMISHNWGCGSVKWSNTVLGFWK